MNRVPTLLCATLALLVVSVTVPAIAARPAPVKETITCHQLLGGRSTRDTQHFSVTPTGLYNDTNLLSSTQMVELGGFTEPNGTRVKSFAKHEWRGGKLYRTVFWQKPGEQMRPSMREIYDFRAQKIWDVTRKPLETCHHEGR
jgi:hypothetical protein